MDKIIFYDKLDNDGRGARAVFEMAHKNEAPLYIGLDRDLKDKNKVHYLDFLMGYKDDIDCVYFLDLAPRTAVETEKLMGFASEYYRVTIIDHHKLKYDPTNYGFKYIYENGVSACMLTWKHFCKEEKAPYVVELINDRDVWLNKMQPHTNLFHNVNEMMNQQELLDVIIQTRQEDFEDLNSWFLIGKIREKSNQKEIDRELKNMKFATLFGVNIALMGGDINYDILSELGNRACELYKDKVDAYVHVRQKENGLWSYSMRSLNGQARKIISDNNLNGDGHDNACGFKDERYLIK